MRTPVKLCAGLGLMLSGAAVTALFLLVAAVDSQVFKKPLSAFITRATGLNADLQGRTTLSLLPRIALHLHRTRLTRQDLPGNPEMLRVGSATLALHIPSLLQGRLAFSDISAEKVRLSLTRDRAGKLIWRPPSRTISEPRSPASAETFLHHLRRISVSQSAIIWKNQDNEAPFLLDRLRVSLDIPGVDGDAGLHVAGSYRPPGHDFSVQLTGNSTCLLAPDGKNLLLKGFRTRLQLQGGAFPAGQAEVQIAGSLALYPAENKLVARAVSIHGPDTDLFISSTLHLTPLHWEGSLLLNTRPRTLLATLGMGELPGETSGTFRQLDLSSHFKASPGVLHLPRFHGTIDGQTFRGDSRISQISAPLLRFNLALDRFDLTPYFAGTGTPKDSAAPLQKRKKKALSRPLPSLLQTLRIRGNLNAGSLTWQGTTVTDVSTMVRSNKGILRIYPLKAQWNNGSVRGNLRVDLNTPRPALTLKTNLQGASLNELPEQGTRQAALLGTLSSFADITCTTTPWAPDLSTLRGTASITVTQGSLVGLDLFQESRDPSEEQNATVSPLVQPFDTLSATGVLKNSILSTRDFLLRTDRIEARGTGSYSFATGQIRGELHLHDPTSGPKTVEIRGSARRPATRLLTPAFPELPDQQSRAHSGPLTAHTLKTP